MIMQLLPSARAPGASASKVGLPQSATLGDPPGVVVAPLQP
jgi:hypothetical protein